MIPKEGIFLGLQSFAITGVLYGSKPEVSSIYLSLGILCTFLLALAQISNSTHRITEPSHSSRSGNDMTRDEFNAFMKRLLFGGVGAIVVYLSGFIFIYQNIDSLLVMYVAVVVLHVLIMLPFVPVARYMSYHSN